MSKNRKKHYISIKSFIIISVSIVMMLSSFVTFRGIVDLMNRNEITALLNDTERRAIRLSNDLALYKLDMKTEDTSLDTDINESAYFSNGRIMVISRNYQIIKDTYVLKQNDYIVSGDVMSVMTGEVESIKRIRGDYAEVILPIKRDNTILGVIVSTASLSGMKENITSISNQSILLMVIMLFVNIAIVVFIVKIAIRRLDSINRQIYHTSQGNLHDKIEEKGFKETKALARNYNAVLEKLATVDSARQEFVSNVSHELKTPVTSMKVLAESLLQNEAATAEDYKDFMSDIVEEVDRETQIINDLLTLVRTDRNSNAMNFAETSINDILDGIIKTVTPLAKQRGIELNYESYRDVKAEVDSVKLSLAISNLVENAVKYNVDNGWIRVSLNADQRFFYIKVADSGVGIPDDSKDKVFERFYRVDKARSRDTGGTGLGLSITRNIINAHQGVVRLYSESGKGTTFSVRIPLNQRIALDSLTDAAVDKEMFDVAFDTEQLTEIKAKKKTKEVLTVLLLAGFMLTSQVFTACTSSPSVTEEVSQESITGTAGTVQLYHVEDDGVVPDSERYQLKQPDSISDSIEEVMNQLVLLNGLSFTGYSIDKDGNIVLYLMEDGLTEEQLLLSKAAIVKSVSGLNKTGDTVITIDDAAGNEIDSAIYRDNAFFYYDDAEDSAINKGEIILYLPNEHGNRLRKVTAYVTISSDESASEAVMKQLIAYNVLPSGTEIRSISVMNGTATLDLSGEFLTGDVTAGDRIVIYSIVNSLTSLQNVRGVLFLVNGKSIDNFHDVVDTSIPLEFSDE
ncbi:MAG: GerMN domain-containing protein [Eubacterium sp.]|nr:GerMN domain-containing protein [Eubacterium sp.]